jgi:antitoxin MazE
MCATPTRSDEWANDRTPQVTANIEASDSMELAPNTDNHLRTGIDILKKMYIKGDSMQISKWGNSLAIRLPATVVDALELKDGDQIEIRIAGARQFEVSRDRSREEAIERLRRLRRPLPAGFTFDRNAANER